MAVLDKNGTEYLWNKAKEKFVAKDDVPETPEDVVLYTEQSLTDSQKAQARGNIGAVKSWDELEDKPFVEASETEEVLFEEQSISLEVAETGAFCTGVIGYRVLIGAIQTDNTLPFDVVEGGEYCISFDGVSYASMAKLCLDCGFVDAEGSLKVICIGNAKIAVESMGELDPSYMTVNYVDDEDTGEPFGLVFQDMTQTDGEIWYSQVVAAFVVNGSETISKTVSVKKINKVPEKLNEEQMPPLSIYDLKEQPFGGAMSDTLTWDMNTDGRECVVLGGMSFYHVSDIVPHSGMMSDDVTVTLSGGETMKGYKQITAGLMMPESVAFVLVAPSDGYPFDGVPFPKKGIYFVYMGADAGVCSLTIPGCGLFEGSKQIKDECIPNSVARVGQAYPYVVLTSSTSGSTKKFKLTVDDSGTITAAEVV